MQLVLASSSRYRAELIGRLGLPFEAVAPDVDESALPGEHPHALVERLAELKARSVAKQRASALIVGSDQVAACDDRVLTKPGTANSAIDQLQRLSGRTARFYTGLVLFNPSTGRVHRAVETVDVAFRTLSRAEIVDYVAREVPLDCAGAFKAEGLGIALMARIDSSDPTTLIGLPLIRLVQFLHDEGLRVLAQR